MKKIFLSALLLAGVAQAQTIDPSYIFYYQHQNLVNPAAVGLERGHTISVDIRNQWRGMTEAPQTQTFFTTHRLSDRVGVGITKFLYRNKPVFMPIFPTQFLLLTTLI